MADSNPESSSSVPTSLMNALPGALAPDVVVFGRYRLIEEVGRGGFGVVWHARDEELALDVALKFLPDLVARDPEAIEDLKREIRRGLRLAHAGIVRVNNFLRNEQLAAISMEYIDGTTLRQCKQAAPGGCIDADELRPWIEQLVEILAYVHDTAKLVHRDLKPGNVMLTKAGEIKIADFGIASSVSDSMTRMTNTPASGGTLSYMSPQQARGEAPTITDDMYALGATVFELLAGKPPFYRGDIALQACEVQPPTMMARREELRVTGKDPIPASWELAVATCLAKDSHLRPQSARDFLTLLDSTAEGEGTFPTYVPESVRKPPVERIAPAPYVAAPAAEAAHVSTPQWSPLPPPRLQPPPLPPPPPWTAPRRSFKPWLWLAAAVVTVVVACGGLGWWLARRAHDHGGNPNGDHRRERSSNTEAEKIYLDGLAHENGSGRSIDGSQAAAAYQRASDLGHAGATARLARMHNYGYGVRRDLVRARLLAEQAAAQGDPLAANLAAVLTRGQHKTGPEVTRAVQYLEQAASAGLPLGILNLAEHLREGRGTSQDTRRADDLDRNAFAAWREAAAKGNADAHYWLGFCHDSGRGTSRDAQAAFREYQIAAQAGVPRAITAVAIAYAAGQGTALDPAQALAHFDKAMQAGWTEAITVLAARHVTGSGVPKDLPRARLLYEQAIQRGSTEAMWRLGELMRRGEGGSADTGRAVALYRQAAEAGDPTGWCRLGYMYEVGLGVTKDAAEGYRCYIRAAGQRDAEGEYYAARALRLGFGTTADASQARAYFERAADASLPGAQTELGEMLRAGEGGAADVTRANDLFRRVADGGYAPAQYNYGYSLENGLGVAKDETSAAQWYGRAAEKEHSPAQTALGKLYRFGRGVPKDLSKAVNLFGAAARQGNAVGQFFYGLSYDNGEGVPRDYSVAREWYEKGANNGDLGSMNNLGLLLRDGRGGAKDPARAFTWFRKSAESGNEYAMSNMGDCYDQGTGVRENKNEAFEWYQKAAERGHMNGQFKLGWYYHNGYVVTRDYIVARQWYEKAAAQNNPTAINNLGVLYIQGLGVKANKPVAMEYFRRAADLGDETAKKNLRQFGGKE